VDGVELRCACCDAASVAGGSEGAADDVGPFELVAEGVMEGDEGEEGAAAGIAEPDGGGAAGLVADPWTVDATGPGAGVVRGPRGPSRPSRTDTGAASSEADETGPGMVYEPTARGQDRCVTTARQSCILHCPCRPSRATTLTWPRAERR
jgi:hypothetical protein